MIALSYNKKRHEEKETTNGYTHPITHRFISHSCLIVSVTRIEMIL
ncbi:hypothetical protein GOICGAJE_02710 [Bacillus sp. MB95]|uniref:Uncharacterized protein n=1 Tax=Priestia megaterium TaxID=1404 RepID=A0AAX6BGE2_PRIMG|nr:hypothetical protein [Bacillus sp. S34]NGY90244.1 hypothetical protein [Priestia megaterium]NHH94159.1 hypothetical protein [Bacillus sp. MB95]GMG72822.1 hypothetical protein ShirakiTB12_12900 [Priestia megaterium]